MKLEKIITLANAKVELRFRAMERSLRATGCDLPLWVIPYDDARFELPPNATWWEIPEIIDWTNREKTHPMMRKYQCLTVSGYQFVDSDIIFLRNPARALEAENGFVTSCGHWRHPSDAISPPSVAIFRAASTTWETGVFNSGQFACDRALYDFAALQAVANDPRYRDIILRFPYHEQPGMVLLTHLSGVPVRNMTLPPLKMESTWAGDYPDKNYAHYWKDEMHTPYLIHWAGCDMSIGRPIDRLFTGYLTEEEKAEWQQEVAARARAEAKRKRSPMGLLRKIVHAARAGLREWRR